MKSRAGDTHYSALMVDSSDCGRGHGVERFRALARQRGGTNQMTTIEIVAVLVLLVFLRQSTAVLKLIDRLGASQK